MSSDKFKVIFRKYGRFVLAGALFVVLILVAVLVLNNKKNPSGEAGKDDIDAKVSAPFEVDKDQKLRDLILSYYNYYSAGDTASLERIAKNLSESEKGFVEMFSDLVDSYENLKCYVKEGLEEGSYIVNAAIDIRFAGMSTLAPGLDFFYVETDEDGDYYINSLYCQFNSMTNEQATDPAVSSMIERFEAQEDVIKLQTDVQARYEAAVGSDPDLGEFINTTVHDAYATWAEAVRKEKEAAEAPAEPETEAAPDLSNMTLLTVDRVNVRDVPGTEGNVLETLDPDTEVTLRSDMANGWYEIEHAGTVGYIRADFLKNPADEGAAGSGTEGGEAPAPAEGQETPAPAEEPAPAEPQEEAPAPSGGSAPSAGSVIRITSSINVRASMSETADKLGTAYEGEYVKVIDSYAEGWTKVEWNGQTGFIRSDLLQQ